MASEREVGAPEGTSIEVDDLFYNLPARRKFLKSDTAESTQISRLVTQMALGYPEVGFSLTSGVRRLLDCPPAAGLRERFFQLFGERGDLIEVRKEAGGLKIHGYVAALGDQGPVRGQQNVFVNRRIVKDRTIAHAITEAYSVATIKERSPEVHLFIEIAPDRVDVNVHPTKAEVRFLEQSLVHEVLRRALGDTLGQGPAPELQFTPFAPRPGEPQAMSIPGVLAGASVASRWGAGPSSVPSSAYSSAAWSERPPSVEAAAMPQAGVDIRPMIPLGQFRDTFIIAIDDEGVAIIDQHVAHERVLFERVMESLTTGAAREPAAADADADRDVVGAAAGARPAHGNARPIRPGGRGVRRRQPAAVRRARHPRSGRVRGRGAGVGRGSRGPRQGLDACRMRCAGLPRPWPATPP